MEPGDMIDVGDFAKVKDDFMKEHGIVKDDLIYVAGSMTVPTDGKDPYNMRKLFVAAKVDEGGHVLVNDGAFTVDGLRLECVPEDRQEELDAIKKEDFDYVDHPEDS